MSQSSLPNPRPLSQLTPQQVLKALRHPSAIAVLASIGVHGLLAVVLPLLPMKSEEPKKPRPVKVVALTPAEQGRLGLGRGNGFGNGNGNGLRSSNPLPDLSSLPPSYPLSSPTPNPFYSFPPAAPPVEQFDDYTINAGRPNSTTDPAGTTEPGTKPSAKPSSSPSGKTGGGGSGGGGSGGQLAAVCPIPPDNSPACQKVEKDRKIAQLRDKYASSRTKELTSDEFYTEYNKSWQPFMDNATALVGGKTENVKELPNKGTVSDQLPSESCPVIKVALRAQVGAIIKPDGTPNDVAVLVSSGNQVLDAIAKAYVIEDIKKVAQSSSVKDIQAEDIKKRGKPSTAIAIQYPFLFDPQVSDSCR